MSEEEIIKKFTKLFHTVKEQTTWRNTKWLGIQALKNPMDCWIYQEIIYKVKPNIIIECGTAAGGGTLFLANMCDLIGKGKVISIDILESDTSRHYKEGDRPQHKRITYLTGSSIDPEIVSKVKSIIKPNDVVLVNLDSCHKYNHVLKELEIYSRIVTKGSYIIVEDTNLRGSSKAVNVFLSGNKKNFKIDKSKEKYLLTFNKNGFLLKIK